MERFIAERDSLNASILGPDAAPGTPEFGLFVAEVVNEMTVKAGQKCTAIRRAIAPAAFLDAVIDGVQRDGTCWLGATTWQGKRLIRISFSNWTTTESDVDRSAEAARFLDLTRGAELGGVRKPHAQEL